MGNIIIIVLIIMINITDCPTICNTIMFAINIIISRINILRKRRLLLPQATGCLTVGNVGKIHLRSDTCPVRVILIQKILFLQLLHGFKLFHLVSDFQNSFCF